ncbi:MAG: hypothetical protein M3520_13180, partial [Actinomycetota bacterium]|nr:hypothetical protein [Actinomycetota bacterium]
VAPVARTTAPAARTTAPAARTTREDEPSHDDEDLDSQGTVGQPVVESVLGGTVLSVDDDQSR